MKNAGLEMDAKYFEEQTGIPSTRATPITTKPFTDSIKNKLEKIYK